MAALTKEMMTRMPIVSGHTVGAAGAIEAAISLACLQHGKLPASTGFSMQGPELPACLVNMMTPQNRDKQPGSFLTPDNFTKLSLWFEKLDKLL